MFTDRETMFRILNQWDAKTYGEALSDIPVTEENGNIIELLSYVLDKQKLRDQTMNGNSTQHLEQTEQEKMRIVYVKIPGLMEETREYWTPLDILYYVCELAETKNKAFYESKAKSLGISYERLVAQICARAIRTLPSWLREQQLRLALQHGFRKATFEQNEELDLHNHCDLKMVLDDKTYYVWSFILSTRSIANFASKFTDSRFGHVPSGAHLVCAFDRDNENHKVQYKGWAFHSKKYVDEVRAAIYQREPAKYENFCLTALRKIGSYNRPLVVVK